MLQPLAAVPPVGCLFPVTKCCRQRVLPVCPAPVLLVTVPPGPSAFPLPQQLYDECSLQVQVDYDP